MRSRSWLWTAVLALVAAPALVNLACDDPSVIDITDPVLPLSNQRIVAEHSYGTPNQNSSLYGVYEANTGAYYFKGQLDGDYVLGEFSNAGQIAWSTIQSDRVRGIFPITDNTIGLAEGMLIVGGRDTNGDGNADRARIGLVGAGGGEIDEWLIAKPDTTLWLNSVDRVDQLTFVAVGGALINDVTYCPYAVTFEIRSDSTLLVLTDTVLSTVQDQYYGAVKCDPAGGGGDDFSCYTVMMTNVTGAGPEGVAVQAFTGSKSDACAYSVDWTVEFARSEQLDTWFYADVMKLYDGTVYVAGTGDFIKQNETGDLVQWTAGFIGSVSTTGALNWFRMVPLSEHGDQYYDLWVSADVIYAVGVYDDYTTTNDDQTHGLALVSMFDRSTGKARYHVGFGATGYSSGFSAILLHDPYVACAGWSHYSVSGTGYQAWLTEIDLDGVGKQDGILLPESYTVPCR